MLTKYSRVVLVGLLAFQTAYSNEMEVNKQLLSLGAETAFIKGPGGVVQKVTYENKGEFGLFEGDILVRTESSKRFSSLLAPNGAVIDGFRWPNNTLYYRFDSVTSGVMSMVREAVQHIRDNTNVNIIELSSAAGAPYHVTVQDSDSACYSYVGMAADSFSSSQPLNVVTGCGFGATVHEFLHALGLWHEQSREDRDNFVTINYENIQSTFEHNFDQADVTSSTDIRTYDFGSIMHYGAYDFNSNGQPTIETIPPGVPIGQRAGMSQIDIDTINDIYPISLAPDLLVNSASVSDSTLDVGTSFTLSATVQNLGGLPADASTLTYYRSTNATISTADTLQGTDPVVVLSVGNASIESIVLTAPTTVGNYYYGACVSSVSGELSTSNNCSSAVLVNVLAVLVADFYEPNDSSVQAKAITPVSAQAHNIHVLGDQDWLQFTLDVASNVTIETSGLGIIDDTTLELFDSELQSVEFDDDGGLGLFSKIIKNDLSAGAYYIVVKEFDDNGLVESYSVDVSAVALDQEEDGGEILDLLPAIISGALRNR